MKNNNDEILDIIEQTKLSIQNTHKQERQLIKVINKPFNKTLTLLKCIMFLMFFMLCFAYAIIFFLMNGGGEGIQWATDIGKETSRQTITTALHLIDIMIGGVVGWKLGKSEKQKDNIE